MIPFLGVFGPRGESHPFFTLKWTCIWITSTRFAQILCESLAFYTSNCHNIILTDMMDCIISASRSRNSFSHHWEFVYRCRSLNIVEFFLQFL